MRKNELWLKVQIPPLPAPNILAPINNLLTLPLIHVRNQVVTIANVDKGSKVLDVATGTGQQAFAFSKAGHDVTGVDLTESMLAVARRHNKNDFVKFEVGDATHLWFEENTFDISCISFALHDMPLNIREKVLREIVRVTKPKGVIMIVEYDLPHNQISNKLIYRFITLYESEYYKQFISSDLNVMLDKTGIEVVERVPILFGAGRIWKGIKNTVKEP
jgi:demethylmenaquinone methyltransferase/2-methoxy-6-polyprenyl-1,4-benzoquinol methylase